MSQYTKRVLTLDEKRALTSADVTLNGQPARVTGYLHGFAMVTLRDSGLGCQWSWPTVEHIVKNRDGRFQA